MRQHSLNHLEGEYFSGNANQAQALILLAMWLVDNPDVIVVSLTFNFVEHNMTWDLCVVYEVI